MEAIEHWHGAWLFPLFWIGAVLLLVLLLGGRWLWWRREGRGGDEHGSGERFLAERYARGEIDEDEYRRRLAVLRGGGR